MYSGIRGFLLLFRRGALRSLSVAHTLPSSVKAVTFVGTTGVGKQVYSKAAAHGKRVQAQCEAKNHALVLEDCNLEATVNAIINSTYGCAGMRCMALPVVCVQDSIADEFVSLLKKKAEAMKLGCAYDEDTDLGPVVNACIPQQNPA